MASVAAVLFPFLAPAGMSMPAECYQVWSNGSYKTVPRSVVRMGDQVRFRCKAWPDWTHTECQGWVADTGNMEIVDGKLAGLLKSDPGTPKSSFILGEVMEKWQKR